MRLSDGAMAELTALTADERTAVIRALEAGDRDADEAGAPAPNLPIARPITHWQNETAPAAVLWRDLGEAKPSGNSDEAKDAICSTGEPCILAAPGGSGKSYLTLALAATAVGAASAEAAFGTACGLRIRPGPVVLLSYEDRPRRTWHRFRYVAGTDNCVIPDEVRANVHVIDPAVPLYEADPDKRLGIRPALGWAALWTAVEKVQPSLVIVDPLSAALEGVSVNEGSAVRRFMAAVADASDRFNVGLMFVAHDTKAARSETRRGGDPGAGAVAGSGVWFDAARAVVYLFTHGATGERLLQALKVNNGRAGWGRALDAIGGNNTGQPFAGFRADGDDLDPEAATAMRSEWEAALTREATERDTRAKAEGRVAAKAKNTVGNENNEANPFK